MAARLKTRLCQYGCSLSPSEFRELVGDLKDVMFPDFTDEHLSFTRDEADQYCEAVRNRAGCKALPRVFILHCLANIRKHDIKA